MLLVLMPVGGVRWCCQEAIEGKLDAKKFPFLAGGPKAGNVGNAPVR